MKDNAAAELHSRPRGAMRPEWKRDERRHKFGLGDVVSLIGRAGETCSKERDRELEAGRFQITRLLPFESDVFQYRIEDRITGRERVVAEQQILVYLP